MAFEAHFRQCRSTFYAVLKQIFPWDFFGFVINPIPGFFFNGEFVDFKAVEEIVEKGVK
jgi:hypothetical protein